MLSLIGLGISGDITLYGKKSAQEADEVYCELHTGVLHRGLFKKIEKLIKKKVTILERELIESDFIIKKAKEKKIVLFVPGDPFMATTHYTLVQDAKKQKIKIEVIHNSSIFTAAPGKTGLQHYKFGKTATLAYWRKNYTPTSALEIVEENLRNGMHTLLLLDLDVVLGPMDAKKAFEQIEKIEKKLGRKIIDKVIVLSRIGWKDEKIHYGELLKLKKINLGKPPFCFIIPGKLHFAEKESLEKFTKDF